ncbi:MAG: response regulator transcription factor, partial [Bacteroidales bacterium]
MQIVMFIRGKEYCTGVVFVILYEMIKSEKNVLVYDRDTVFLSGLIYILKEMPDILNVSGYSSEKEIQRELETKNYDLFIVEVNALDPNGIAIIEEIHSSGNNRRVLVNTICEEELLWEILKHTRISGLLHKRAEAGEVESAVRRILRDECYCTPAYCKMGALFPREPFSDIYSEDSPTRRELEVLNAISHGDSSVLIAEKLKISENTVESFRKKLMQKFDAR